MFWPVKDCFVVEHVEFWVPKSSEKTCEQFQCLLHFRVKEWGSCQKTSIFVFWVWKCEALNTLGCKMICERLRNLSVPRLKALSRNFCRMWRNVKHSTEFYQFDSWSCHMVFCPKASVFFNKILRLELDR